MSDLRTQLEAFLQRQRQEFVDLQGAREDLHVEVGELAKDFDVVQI